MEDRTLLASFLVTTAADNGDNTNPVPGSLRQAILSSNAVTGPNTIDFNIPAESMAEFPVPIAGSVPVGITSGPDGALWFVERSGNYVARMTTLGTVTAEYPIPTSGSQPILITTGPDGDFWFTENAGNKIGRLAPTTIVTSSAETVPADATVTRFGGGVYTAGSTIPAGTTLPAGTITEYAVPTPNSGPWGIAQGPDGAMWFTENIHQLGRVAPATGAITEFALPSGSLNVGGLTNGPDGNLWYADLNGFIGRVTTAGVVTTFATSVADSQPYTVKVGPDGALWFPERTGKIGRITATDATTAADAVVPADAVTYTPGGTVYTAGSTIPAGTLLPAGTITEYTVPTSGSQPIDLTVGADGALWFTEFLGASKIGRLTPDGTFTEFAVPNGGVAPAGIAAGSDGNIWFTEYLGDRVGRLGGPLTILPTAPLPAITQPVTIDGTTQPGYAGTPVVVLDGAAAGSASGLTIVAGDSTVKGLVVNSFSVDGLDLETNGGDTIQSNYIGTDPTGRIAQPNDGMGIAVLGDFGDTIGGTAAGAGNVVSGNLECGLYLDSMGNVVQGNLIGTDATGTAPLGNVATGIEILGSYSNQIGGTTAGAGNTIAYNNTADIAGDGGVLVGGSGDAIEGNSIHDNTGLGIDLGGDGVTLNGSHAGQSGPNNWQEFPVITSAIGGAATQVAGSLTGTPGATYTLDFYANAVADPSGYGQGAIYLGSGTVTIDSTGTTAFAVTVPGSTTPGELITATATDSAGDTSEFSLDVPITTVAVTTTADSGPGSLRQAILDVNAGRGGDTIDFNIPFDPVNLFSITRTIYLASPLPPITEPVTIDGYTQPAAQPNTLTIGNNAALMIYLDGTSAGSSADGLTLDASGITVSGLVIDNFSGNGIVIDSGGDTVEGNHVGGTMVGSTISKATGVW